MSSAASYKKALKQAIRTAEAAGWTVRQTKGGHVQFLAPDRKTIVVTSSTPSDHRSWANFRATMKRAGLDI